MRLQALVAFGQIDKKQKVWLKPDFESNQTDTIPQKSITSNPCIFHFFSEIAQ